MNTNTCFSYSKKSNNHNVNALTSISGSSDIDNIIPFPGTYTSALPASTSSTAILTATPTNIPLLPPHEPVEPLKSDAEISEALTYFLSRPQRWKANPNTVRDQMMFVIGINFAIRISDLLSLHLYDFIEEGKDLIIFKSHILIREGKTKKPRYVYITEPVQKAVSLYLESLPSFSLTDPLFLSRERDSFGNPKAIGRSMAHNIMSELGDAIDKHLGTHSLRKTWATMALKNNPDNPEVIALISEILNHTSEKCTRRYLGLDTAMKKEFILANQLG